MNAKELYTKQITDFCDKNCDITAEDILAKAKNRTIVPDDTAEMTYIDNTAADIKPFPSGNQKVLRFVNIAAVCVLCFLLASASIMAATGHLGDIMKNIIGDKETTEIVERGFYYELQATQSDDIFTATLVGFTGDRLNPKIIIDLQINDSELLATTDNVSIKVYSLGVNEFENELENYMYHEAQGVRDEKIPNLYHFNVDGSSAWLTQGGECVIQIYEITLKGNGNPWRFYDVDFQYQLTIPRDSFHPAPYEPYTGVYFSYGDVTYNLNAAQYGYYYTVISLYSDTVAENPPTTKAEFYAADSHMNNNWLEIAPTATLVVDGTEYSILEESGYSSVWFNTEGEIVPLNRCSMHLYFPPIKYGSAKNIILQIGGESVILKSTGETLPEKEIDRNEELPETGEDALPDEYVIDWKDENLEAAMRKQTGIYKRDIVYGDVKGIIELNLADKDISDISALSHLTNLTYLNLLSNSISDISALSSLTNLEYLNLWGNDISDISALSSLVNLEHLDLSRNSISDISTLGNLTKLTYLGLIDNNISDYSPVSHVPNLKY